MTRKAVFEAALTLPVDDRMELADQLWASLGRRTATKFSGDFGQSGLNELSVP